MTKPIPATEYPILISIVNESYTDGLDRILSARENDDGSIVCVGQDGVKQVACKITDTKVEIRLLNPDQVKGDSPNTAKFSRQPDTSDQIAVNLQRIGDPIVAGWLQQIQQVLETSDDLPNAREALFQLYPELDSSDLTEQMTDAMALANMAGFWEAQQADGDN
jgi:phage gp29-like protein